MKELPKAMLEKTDAILKEIKEDIITKQEEMLAKIEAHQERMMAKTDSQLEKMEACMGKTEATDLEAKTEEIKSEGLHEEVPKEEASVKTVRALKKRHGDRQLAVRRRGQPKKRTQGDGGFRKNLVATSRGTTRHALSSGTRPGQCCKRSP
jgi:antitoxin (DNA-binding transcriptional repressor) of toxin-antitoxin stability system